MAEFNPTPFKGEATVPHVPEDWFTNLFIGTQLAVAVTMFPGRLFGLAPRPNRLNRDHAVACANEAAMSGAARRGRVPTLALNKPRATAASWRSMWAKHLHWKAWTLDRQGGGYTPRV